MDDGMASVGRDTAQTVVCAPFVLGVAPGAIVAGFDVHRRQITFDALDTVTGSCGAGSWSRRPAAVEEWVGRFPGREIHVAVEACTGWLFVCRALERTGAVAHLAEPVETSALRGRKRRAKTDRADAKWLRQLLCEGRLPEAWCPPEHVRAVALPRPAAEHSVGGAHQLDPADPRDPRITTGSPAPRMSCARSPAASS